MVMKYLRDVTSIRIDGEKCTGCGLCLTVCPHQVIALTDGRAAVKDRDACMECGACQRNCPFEAVTVEAGVGCAYAIVKGMIRGTAPDCGCGEGDSSSACY